MGESQALPYRYLEASEEMHKQENYIVQWTEPQDSTEKQRLEIEVVVVTQARKVGRTEKERVRGRLRTSIGGAGQVGVIQIALKSLSLPHNVPAQPHRKFRVCVGVGVCVLNAWSHESVVISGRTNCLNHMRLFRFAKCVYSDLLMEWKFLGSERKRRVVRGRKGDTKGLCCNHAPV